MSEEQPGVVQPAAKKKKVGRIVAWTLGGLLAAAGATYGIGYAVAGDVVPKGTSVRDVTLTGLTPEEAIAKLKAELGPSLEAPLTLKDGDKTAEINPKDAGLSPDFEATIANAGGRSWNPVDIWRVLFGGKSIDLVYQEDSTALRAAVADTGKTFKQDAVSATVTFDGVKPVRTEGLPAKELNVDETMKAVVDAWVAGQSTVEPSITSQEPEITTAEADAIVAKYDNLAPIEIVTEKGSLNLTPEMIAAATEFVAANGDLQAKTSVEKLLGELEPAITALKLPAAKDASFTFANGRPTIVPSVDGLTLDESEITAKVLPIITNSGERKVAIDLVKAPPQFTTEDAQKLGIKEVTGEFTTYFPNSGYRNNNIPRAARSLNGTLIKPGETFSFNKVVGQRTVANGYMAGGAICPGNKMCQQLGGGVSQVATTTYNAFFFSGLKHITHQPHTLYFSRYPAGREATIDWGHIDVSFYNDTPYGVYIQGIGIPGSGSRGGSVTIRTWSTKEYDVRSSDLVRSNYVSPRTVTSTAPDCEPQSGQSGFDVNYRRLWYKGGKLVKSEPYFWRYHKTDTIICQSG